MILFPDFISFRGVLALYFIILSSGLQAQEDLFNQKNSTGYGAYLLENGNCEMALVEFQRAWFLDSTAMGLKNYMLKAYRSCHRYEEGILFYKKNYNSSDTGMLGKREYAISLLRSERWSQLDSLLESQRTNSLPDHCFMKLSSYVLREKWASASSLMSQCSSSLKPFQNEGMEALIRDGLHYRIRRPWLSAALSAVVPGSGKFYTGEWQDGIFALAVIGAGTWQTYRQFHNNGPDNFLSWGFLCFTSSFYISNIVGSWRSALKINLKKKQQHYHAIQSLLDITYP